MTKKINREKAKILFAETILKKSNCDLPELKIDFPYYDYAEEINTYLNEGKLTGLSRKALDQIQQEDLFNLEFEEAFQPIYRDYLIFTFQFSTNKYLEKKLVEIGIKASVIGKIEPAGLCPCCKYYSIDFGEDGAWDICPVCFWENGGDGPNRMTLEEAQNNFEKYGVMSQSHLTSIDPEGKIKFRKA